MRGTVKETVFSHWLRYTLDTKSQTVRGLAREIAGEEASVTEVETIRRALNKYLAEGRWPGTAMRSAIADALGVSGNKMPEKH